MIISVHIPVTLIVIKWLLLTIPLFSTDLNIDGEVEANVIKLHAESSR